MLGKPRILFLSQTCLINSIIHEHSCKILYVSLPHGAIGQSMIYACGISWVIFTCCCCFYLTHLCHLYIPILINWMSPVIGWYFSFLFDFKRNFFANSGEPDQTLHFLVLHCLPMYHKKDARLIWVNVKH